MRLKEACDILEIEVLEGINVEVVKRQYRKKALKYHPDKNPGDESAQAIFQELNEAYQYMMQIYDRPDIFREDESDSGQGSNESTGYVGILLSFLKSTIHRDFLDNSQSRIFYMIVNKIASSCEGKAVELMERLDKEVLLKIQELLKKHQDVFHFSDHFLVLVEEVIRKKTVMDERIILYTFIEDLLSDNVYRMMVGVNIYYIPLWAHELVYDNGGYDIYIECVPILPDNMSIDSDNNLHIILDYKIADIWGQDMVQVNIGNRGFSFDPSLLKLSPDNRVVLAKQGLAKLNTKNVYDVSKRADIHLHIQLVL